MYLKNDPLLYAAEYCMVFPRGMEKEHKVGVGSLVIEEDYIIYFKAETPEDIKQRFIKDYAEYHRKELEEQKNGIFR